MRRLVRQPRSKSLFSIWGRSLRTDVAVLLRPTLGLALITSCNHSIMAITRAKKEAIVEKLESIKNDSASLVFVGFRGLTVAESTAMRDALREAGVQYFVAKKTLIRRTLGDAFTGEMPEFDGEIAVAYSEDLIAPAQHVKKFAETYKDRVDIQGGVFEGVFKDKAEMTEIASIPSLPTLYGMFANFLQQPAQGLALAIQAVAEAKEQQA